MAGQEGYELIRIMGNRDPLDFLRERAAAGPTPLWGRLNALLKEWPGLDLVVYQHGFDISPMPVERLRVPGGPGSMVIAAKACELPKALVLHSFGSDNTWQASAELRAFCAELGLPLFLSMRGAATALRRLIDYNKAYPDRLSRLHAPTEV